MTCQRTYRIDLLSTALRCAVVLCVSFLTGNHALAASDPASLSTGMLFDRGRVCVAVPDKADSALIYFGVIINRYAHDQSPEGRHYAARAYNNRGYVWEYMKYDYQKAMADLLQSLNICESLSEKLPTEAFVCLNLANIFDNYYNHRQESRCYRERSVEYWMRSMSVARDLKEWEIMLRSYLPLATKCLEDASSEEGRRKLLELSAIIKESNIPNGIPMVEYCKVRARALEAVARNDLDGAASLLRSELQYIDTDLTPERYRIDTYNSLIALYGMKGEPDSVRHYISLTEDVIERHQLVELRPMLSRAKLNYMREVSPGESMDSLQSTLWSESEELLHEHKLDQISDLYLENEIDKSRRNELELKKSETRSRKIIRVVTLLLVIVALGTTILIVQHRRLRRRYRGMYAAAHAAAELELQKRAVSVPPSEAESIPQSKYAGSNLSKDNLTGILQRANDVLDHTDEIYSSEFTLARLADMVETKPRYLSQAISEIDGRNFNALVNERRVREACRRFDDKERYGNMTVEAIGQSVGFKSRSAFSDAFKNVTEMTPSVYARIARAGGGSGSS